MLDFTVNDMLSLSQIREVGQLRKNCSVFGIRQAVAEIMELQQDKALYLGVEFSSRFEGFDGDNYLICTDKHRLQQILLNF
jgi:signal transduction histidine kinase